jgi:hypothetical protein
MFALEMPSPAEHAVVMVEVYRDLPTAKEMAEINWRHAQTMTEFNYWVRVASFLEGGACLPN